MKSFSLILFSSYLFASQALFTTPQCSQYSGGKRGAYPKNIFCTSLDDKLNQVASSVRKELLKIVKNQEVKEVSIAMFDISDELIINNLCQRLKQDRFTLKIVVNSALTLPYLMELEQCVVEKRSEFLLRPVSDSKDIGLFHAKYILAVDNKNNIDLIFSSANLTSGTYRKHENWNFFKLPQKSYLAQKHICHFQALMQMNSSRELFDQLFSKCRSTPPNDEKLISYFVPGEGVVLLKRITKLFRNSKKISIATHRLTSSLIIKTLETFLKRGGDLTFYADGGYLDGVFSQYGHQSPQESLTLLKLLSLGAKIKPIYTNQAHGSFFHHKFMVFDNAFTTENPVVITGSGNFTYSALHDVKWKYRNQKNLKTNFENFYELKDSKLVDQYIEYLSKLSDMPLTSQLRAPFLLEKK